MYRSGPECFHYRSVALCYAVLRFMYQITFCAATAPLLYCTGSHRSNGNGYIQRSTFCNEKLALRRSGNRDRKSTRLNSSHVRTSRMPSSA